MERARLVRRRIIGRSHLCRLDPAPFKQVAEWTEGYRQAWERRFEALDNLLVEMQEKETKHGHAKHAR